MNKFLATIIIAGAVLGATAGPPLNNLQGVGGIAFNPIAYPAGRAWEKPERLDVDFSLGGWLSKPQAGIWYVNLGEVDVDWTTAGVAFNIGKRLELSYGHEIISPPGDDIHKNNLGAKLLLVAENAGDHAWVPAVAVGTIWKETDAALPPGADDDGADFYLVATKFITQLPLPVLVSGGALYTSEYVTGVYGHDDDHDWTWFGNIDVLPHESVAVGIEYKQGSDYGNWRNADYWETHVAWFVNPQVTLVGAYVNAGNEESSRRVGLGEGWVVSLQYAF